MLKFFFSLSLLVGASPLVANEIDYGKFPSIAEGYYPAHHFNVLSWASGGYAFNYAPEITPFFAFLKKAYNINTLIETGTLYGGTTVVFSFLFDTVHTIEIQETNHSRAKELLKSYSNVHCHLGTSDEVIKDLLTHHKNERLFFYLDAHWNDHWPLLNELEEIGKTHQNNCIIVIDDFKVPGRADIVYDQYGAHACSMEYIQDKINKIFTSYDVFFLIPKCTASRAKAVIIPKEWRK